MSLFLQLPSTSSCGFINNWFDTSLLMDIWGYFQSVAFPIHVTSYFANVVSLRTGITGLSYQWNFSRLGHILLRRHWVVLLPATCESRVSPQSCPKSATSNLWVFFLSCPPWKGKVAAQQHLFYQSDETVGCSPGLWSTDAGEQNLQPVGESSMFRVK